METSAPELLAECLARARLHPELLSEDEKHRVFALSSFPAGRALLAAGAPRVPEFALETLRVWHDAQNIDACMRPRLQLLAAYCSSDLFAPQALWATAERIVTSRGRVDSPGIVNGCILHSLAFGGGDAPFRWITRREKLRP